jgi:hypothetical protein
MPPDAPVSMIRYASSPTLPWASLDVVRRRHSTITNLAVNCNPFGVDLPIGAGLTRNYLLPLDMSQAKVRCKLIQQILRDFLISSPRLWVVAHICFLSSPACRLGPCSHGFPGAM